VISPAPSGARRGHRPRGGADGDHRPRLAARFKALGLPSIVGAARDERVLDLGKHRHALIEALEHARATGEVGTSARGPQAWRSSAPRDSGGSADWLEYALRRANKADISVSMEPRSVSLGRDGSAVGQGYGVFAEDGTRKLLVLR
jgi:hypothetical protein